MESAAATLTCIIGILVCGMCVIPLWFLFATTEETRERTSDVDITDEQTS